MDITKNGDLNLELVLESPLVCALFVLVCLEFFFLVQFEGVKKKLLENWHNRAGIAVVSRSERLTPRRVILRRVKWPGMK